MIASSSPLSRLPGRSAPHWPSRCAAAAGPHLDRDAAFDVVEKSIFAAAESRWRTARSRRGSWWSSISRASTPTIKAGPAINAFITLNPHALDDADALDAERRRDRSRGPLHGIPIAVKDNYATADMPTTGGSQALAGFRPGRDAFMVKKLRDAGAVIIGKTNLHELAYGITSISSHGRADAQPVRSRRATRADRAAAPAPRSRRTSPPPAWAPTPADRFAIPSASNNLFGLRGTQGLSSRDGIMPLSHTQDIGGPLARTVTDLAIMLDATVGFDPADPMTSASKGRIPRTYLSAIGDSRHRRRPHRRRDGAVRRRAGGRRGRPGSSAARSTTSARSAPDVWR